MGASSSSSAVPSFSYDIPDQRGLTNLYNQQVVSVEHMTRPMNSSGGSSGILPHRGNVVTTADGGRFVLQASRTQIFFSFWHNRYLIHKGPNFGISGQTVVVDAKHMGSSWKPVDSRAGPVIVDPANPITVSDLVRESGPNYKTLSDNCWNGAKRVQNEAKK